jgi:hypothetical protein
LQQKIFKKKRVACENVDFEKIFDVTSNDPVATAMIITPAFIDTVMQLIKKTGNMYEFLFQENNLYIKRVIKKTYLDINTEHDMTHNVL